MIRSSMTLLAMLAALMLVGGCGEDDAAPSDGATEPATAAEDSPGASVAPDDVTECATVSAPDPKKDGGATEPTAKLDPAKTNTVTFETSCGDFTVTLDVKAAPKTTASVAELARSGFYDGTVFHRVVPGFVIQGGDPTGTGMGGPGYKTVDEPPSDAAYTSGVVAMAKAADEPAGTSGSQFFVVTTGDAGLPPDYAVIGTVTEGMGVVKAIESLGTASQEPTRPIVIEKATFTAK